MAEARSNPKLKLLYLLKILSEKSSENHPLSMADIRGYLEGYGIEAERKSLYSDMALLEEYGIEIIREQRSRNCFYYIADRKFEMAELKLLVDSVQAARFVTRKKSDGLIKKIMSLAPEDEAKQLSRQVFVTGKVKSDNETILYNVDCIHRAIAENSQVRFQYFNWTVGKKKELRHGGEFYEVSPWILSWDNENYYLVAYDGKAGDIRHYRVDKMLNLELSQQERLGGELFANINMASYTDRMFGMFVGEEKNVRLLCLNRFAGIMIDRFGRDIIMIPADEEHFTVNVNVAVSSQFISWVFSLGDGVKIIGPDDVLGKVKEEVRRLRNAYGEK